MLIVGENEYPIIMYGFIDSGRMLFEMPDVSKEEAESILQNAEEIKYRNSDGWVNDLSNMKFDGFLPDDERTMVLLK